MSHGMGYKLVIDKSRVGHIWVKDGSWVAHGSQDRLQEGQW